MVVSNNRRGSNDFYSVVRMPIALLSRPDRLIKARKTSGYRIFTGGGKSSCLRNSMEGEADAHNLHFPSQIVEMEKGW